MRKASWLLVLVPFLLIGCVGNEKSNESVNTTFYQIDSLLDSQVQYLVSQKAQLQKRNYSEESSSEVLVKMDSMQWVSALSMFRVLDITNPSLKGVYSVKDQLKDSTSNLTILHYQLKKDDEKQRLKELNFYYLGTIDNLKKITAKTSFQSVIYNANNQFELAFEQRQKQTVLKSYTISTTQKTIFKDSVKTVVKFEVQY